LKENLAAAEQERAARTEAERKAAEAARLEAEAQASARAKAAEEQGRRQALSGLSPQEIRKAEELANWDFVKDRNDIQDLRDHLARFPGGTTERYARAKLDALVWAGLGDTPNIEHLRAYLDEFPKGAKAGAVQARIALLEKEAAEARAAERLRAQETEAWGAVAASTDKARIEAFLKDWPKGQYAAAAKSRIVELRRGIGGLKRGVLLGAGITAALAVFGVGWWQQDFLREQYHWRVAMRPSLLTAEQEKAAKPGSEFKECMNGCPTMVVVPAGRFSMGSHLSESYRNKNEGPQHEVTIAKPFAVGMTEVTFAEWDACVAAGGCANASDDTWGRGNQPVINVNWDDAKKYVAWLSRITSKEYRLLTEAEWEYAARAGATTAYSWGPKIEKGNANCTDCGSQWDNKQPAPVSSFKANAFGLYDMHGNVAEWVEDVWHDNYGGAPDNGRAWLQDGDASWRVVRGGCWNYYPQDLRAAYRLGFRFDRRDINLGIRLARTLNP
jgi:formylglycine-generating enzyme required for sulfatase activity